MDKLDDLIGSLLERIMGDDDMPKVLMGVVSEEIAERLEDKKHRMQDWKTEIARKVEDLERQIQREYGPKMDVLKEEKKAIWKDIYAELGLDAGKKYTISTTTREIFLKVEK